MFWLGMIVGRAFGACNRRALVHFKNNMSATMRGDESQLVEEARRLKPTLDA